MGGGGREKLNNDLLVKLKGRRTILTKCKAELQIFLRSPTPGNTSQHITSLQPASHRKRCCGCN